jgi:hypothetical protein
LKTKQSYESQCRNLYKNLGLLGSGVTLKNDCRIGKINKCWKGCGGQGKGVKYYGIILPHIGTNYNSTKLLVIGVNNRANWTHKNGKKVGIDSETIGILEEADNIINDPTNTWRLYDRLAEYCTIVYKLINKQKVPSSFSPQEKADALVKYIALTQSTKCNPDTKTNYPSIHMQKICSENILLEEIKILKAEYIVILGLGNFDVIAPIISHYFNQQRFNFNQIVSRNKSKRIAHCRLTKGDKKIHLIGVEHPSRGSPKSVKQQLSKLAIP